MRLLEKSNTLNILKNIKESEEKLWLGIPDVHYHYHGDWSDPEVEYKGLLYNEWDLQEYIGDTELGETKSNNPNNFHNELLDFGKKFPDEVKAMIEDVVPVGISDDIKFLLEDASSFGVLIARLEDLKKFSSTNIPNKLLDEAIKMAKDNKPEENSYNEDSDDWKEEYDPEALEEIISKIIEFLDNGVKSGKYMNEAFKVRKSKRAIKESAFDPEKVKTFLRKFNSIYGDEPVMKEDGTIYVDNIRLRGSGQSKGIIAKLNPDNTMEVYNEEWGFKYKNGNFSDMENMSQYWFYSNFEDDEEFRNKIETATKALYKNLIDLKSSAIKEAVSPEESDFELRKNFLYAMYDKIKEAWDAIEWHEPMYFDMSTNEKMLCLVISVSWGDWKHEHAALDQIADEATHPFKITNVTTEEDGSDCYSADHYFFYTDRELEKYKKENLKEAVETFTDYKGNFDHDWFMNEVELHIANTYDIYKAACDRRRPASAVANLAIQAAVNTCEPKPFTWGQIKTRINKLGGDFERVQKEATQAVEDFRNEMDEENALNESAKVLKESYEQATDPLERLKNVYLMDRVIRALNNEDGLYEYGWLYEVEDESTDHGFEDFKNNAEEWDYAKSVGKGTYYYTSDEDYNHLVKMYKEILKDCASDGFMTREYFKSSSGNYKWNAGLDEEELAFLKQEIPNPVLYGAGGSVIKESAGMDRIVKDAVKEYGITSVETDEGKQTIKFTVPKARKGVPGTTIEPDYDDGYVCATVDFIDKVESALRDNGMDVEVYGEGESASDGGSFTLEYEPKARGTFGKSNIHIVREATDEEINKLKTELKSRAEDLGKSLSDEDLDKLAQNIKKDGFFISNNIFTDDNDEYEWEQINMYLDNEIRKSLKKSESEKDTLLWTSDGTAWVWDYTDDQIMSEYEDATGEKAEDADQARDYFLYDDMAWDIQKEDWDNWVLPMIKEQTVNNIVILDGSLGLWDGRHGAGKPVDADDLLYAMGSDIDLLELREDKNDKQLYLEGHHHDGTNVMALYTIPSDRDKQIEFLKELGIIDWLNDIYNYDEMNYTAEEDALSRLSSAKEFADVLDGGFGEAIELATPIINKN